MTSFFAWRALLFAGELLAGSAVLMALAWVFGSARNASARHLAWAGAFGATLALPVLAALVPSSLTIVLPAAPAAVPLRVLGDAASAALPSASGDSGLSLDPSAIALALGALWLAGVCAIALRFAAAAFCLAVMRRSSRPFARPPEELPKVAATRRECELRLSESDNGPISWGVFRPVILLPRTAVFWPRQRLHAVLLHELAHIRRRDSFVQALSLLVCALYWPNPFVWLGARALRRAAEIAADDRAIVAGVKPSSYASELLGLAKEFQTRVPDFSPTAFFMAAPSALEARVESVLEPTSLRTGVTAMDGIKIAGLGLISAGAIALACPSLAQNAQAPPVETAPLEPAAPPAPPAPETPPAPVARADAAPHSVFISGNGRVHRLTHADLVRLNIDIARAKRDARAAIELARPQIERAIAEARVSENAMRAVHDAQPEIDAAVANARHEAKEAIAKARPAMERAIAEAKVSERTAATLRETQPAIDAVVNEALANARDELVKAHVDARIEAKVDEALKRAEIRIDAGGAHSGETRREQRTEIPDSPDQPDSPNQD